MKFELNVETVENYKAKILSKYRKMFVLVQIF